MRSRYSAYVLKDEAYLLASKHASTRGERVDFKSNQKWLLLRVLATQTDGDQATVEFIARSLVDGRSHVQHELSEFVRENGRWYYVQGEAR